MADPRYKEAFLAAVEDAEKTHAKYVEQQKLANQLAVLAGEEPPFETEAVAAPAATALRADQFANYPAPSVAARAFLELRGPEKGSASLDVIYEALLAGGFTFTSTKNDPKGGLRVALGKDGQVQRLPNGTYGLKDWYPALKRSTTRSRSGATTDTDAGEDLDSEVDEATDEAAETEEPAVSG